MPNDAVVVDTPVRPLFILKVSFIAGLGGLLYGYDMGIIAAAQIFVRDSFAISTLMQEFVVSVVLIGVMVGALVGGMVADRIGRRATLVWGGLIFIAGSLLAPAATDVYMLIAARALLGIAIGFTSVTAPVYVSELAPPKSRGMLIGLYQLALTLGIALADLVGYWLAAQHAWRLMFGLGAVPAVFFLVLILLQPESPRWLFARGREDEARAVLKTYTNDAGAALLIEEIQTALSMKVEKRWSALWSPAVRGALFIAVGFVVLQQLTGINTILYYGPQIFALAGITSNQGAIFSTLLVAVMNVLGTVIALFLVDRVGRKPLLYVGLSGMVASLFALAYAFHSQPANSAALGIIATVCLMVYITFFAFSLGPIAWIIVSEVFPLEVRGRGVAAATIGYGTSNFIISSVFLTFINATGNIVTFATYGVFCILFLLFVYFVVPETKGRQLESISAHKTQEAS